MVAQILEGNITEIQQGLKDLQVDPDASLRVVVEEQFVKEPVQGTNLEDMKHRDGMLLIPLRRDGIKVTTELIKELSEDW